MVEVPKVCTPHWIMFAPLRWLSLYLNPSLFMTWSKHLQNIEIEELECRKRKYKYISVTIFPVAPHFSDFPIFFFPVAPLHVEAARRKRSPLFPLNQPSKVGIPFYLSSPSLSLFILFFISSLPHIPALSSLFILKCSCHPNATPPIDQVSLAKQLQLYFLIISLTLHDLLYIKGTYASTNKLQLSLSLLWENQKKKIHPNADLSPQPKKRKKKSSHTLSIILTKKK